MRYRASKISYQRPNCGSITLVASTQVSPTSLARASQAIPEHFYCPLSLDVMADPVITEHGQCFDRRWIAAVITAGEPCPLTRRAFETRKLTPNKALKNAITKHPMAQSRASEARREPLPSYRDTYHPRATSNQNAIASGATARLRSVPWENHSDPMTFLLGNPAGMMHSRLSRNNLRRKIEMTQAALLEQERRNTPVDGRAQLAGRIKRLETLLLFANAAAPVTRTVDFVAGTYTQPEGTQSQALQSGVIGAACLTVTVFTCGATIPLVSFTGQGASLLGASIKAGVRLSAQGPAEIARRLAIRDYTRRATENDRNISRATQRS